VAWNARLAVSGVQVGPSGIVDEMPRDGAPAGGVHGKAVSPGLGLLDLRAAPGMITPAQVTG
jgi:hypothetical protein